MSKKTNFGKINGREAMVAVSYTHLDVYKRQHQRYPDAKIVFVARSEESSPKVSFALKQAGASYAVSYTHLDVYKRQRMYFRIKEK